MNTLLLTTPQAKIADDAFRGLTAKVLMGWNVETISSGNIGRLGSLPTVTVVGIGEKTRRDQIKPLISRLADIQTGVPQGTFVVFKFKPPVSQRLRQARVGQLWEGLLQEITINLPKFPHPDRVDVVDSISGLLAKLSLIEAKLKIAPPRPSALDDAKQVVEATKDLRTDKGKLSAAAVADVFGVSLNQLATWLNRTRQALSKTPDADSLQDELGYFERVARLRAVVNQERFLKWLRIPNRQLDKQKPLDLLASGERQVVADLVDDMLTGAPA